VDVEVPAGETTFSYEIRTEDDDVVEGAETFILEIHPVSWTARLGDNSEAVGTIDDNDEVGVEVSADMVEVEEEVSGTYTVKLKSKPTAPVRIVAFSTNTWKVRVTPRVIDIGTRYWDRPHTFSVYGEEDYDAADEEVVIINTIQDSPGAGYEDVTVGSVTVSVDDKHSPEVVVENAAGDASVEPAVGTQAIYQVYLEADPSWIYTEQSNGSYEPYTTCCDWDTHTVTISATSSDPDVATVSPAWVTFDAHSYYPQYFLVTGVSAGTAGITHTVSGTDHLLESAPNTPDPGEVTTWSTPGERRARSWPRHRRQPHHRRLSTCRSPPRRRRGKEPARPTHAPDTRAPRTPWPQRRERRRHA